MVEKFTRREFKNQTTPSEVQNSLRRWIVDVLKYVWTAEPVIVTGYDASKQTVDVKLMNETDNQMSFKNVPIYNTGGTLRFMQEFETTDDALNTPADVGFLIFPRTDSTNSFTDKKLKGKHPGIYHKGRGGIFIPGPLAGSENPPSIFSTSAGATDLDNVGPGDGAIVHKSGSHIIFKENGEIIIKGTEIYFGDTEDNVSTFKKVARAGDDVGGTGATTISEGSDNVFAGD